MSEMEATEGGGDDEGGDGGDDDDDPPAMTLACSLCRRHNPDGCKITGVLT